MATRGRRGSKELVIGGEDRRLAREKLDLKPPSSTPIGMLSQLLVNGQETFMEFAHLAVHIEPGLAPVIEDYASLSPKGRKAVSIDAICVKHDVDPLHLIAVVSEAALKYGNNSSIVLAALRFPEVINRSIKNALTPAGFKDRELLAKHHGFIPTPHGTSIQVNATAGARADASTAPESKGLPSFERTMRDTDDIVRDRE
jgi:hypothetical protein